MLKFNSMTFKDESGKIVEVDVNGTVTCTEQISADEYCIASLYSGLLFGGGFKALLDFMHLKE